MLAIKDGAGLFRKCSVPINLRSDVRNSLSRYFQKYLRPNMDVYDIGCGDKPFANALAGRVRNYIGVDVQDGFYDPSHIDIIGTAYDVPVNDDIADAVISSQVLEHLDRPIDAIKETARILKNDGLFFLSFPFLYPLHAEPIDYGRITEFSIKKMLEQENFQILEFMSIGGLWYVTGLFLDIYLKSMNRGFVKKLKIIPLISWLLSCFFRTLHSIEGMALKALGRDPIKLRRKWPSAYVLVAKKK